MRKIGYYWCRTAEFWDVLYWNYDEWQAPGIALRFTDESFDEIDETPLERKPSYTVDIDALGEINIA